MQRRRTAGSTPEGPPWAAVLCVEAGLERTEHRQGAASACRQNRLPQLPYIKELDLLVQHQVWPLVSGQQMGCWPSSEDVDMCDLLEAGWDALHTPG
jgi:hypothetical protein